MTAARARAKQASDEELRYRDLRGTGAISASAYDQIKAAADAAQAQLSAAEAQSDVARNANRYSDLIADSDGTVVAWAEVLDEHPRDLVPWIGLLEVRAELTRQSYGREAEAAIWVRAEARRKSRTQKGPRRTGG